MQTLKTKTLGWHNIFRPSAADLKWLKKDFDFHGLVFEEIARSTARPKVENFDGYLYLVLHFPIFDERERKTHPREIDFILTKKELISVSYDPIPPLDEFFRSCAQDRSAQELYAAKTPAHLLYFIVKHLYAFALRELDHIHENIDRIDERVFSNEHEEEALIEDLSFVRRDIIDFRRTLKPQQVVLEALALRGEALYGSSLRPFFHELIGEYQKVWNLLENHKEATDALYDNNVTVLNIKQNEAMRILSIMAFVTFPLVLFAQIFSMATVATPLIGHRYDFWIIVGIMLVAATGMFLFFKRKRWL